MAADLLPATSASSLLYPKPTPSNASIKTTHLAFQVSAIHCISPQFAISAHGSVLTLVECGRLPLDLLDGCKRTDWTWSIPAFEGERVIGIRDFGLYLILKLFLVSSGLAARVSSHLDVQCS